jgi:hypothetical protein
LIDTGSDLSCVDPLAIRSLDLEQSGLLPTNSPGLLGLALSPQYSVSFTILDPTSPGPRNLHLADWIVTELDLSLLGHQALIGRDVLSRCLFTFDGPANTFTLTY